MDWRHCSTYPLVPAFAGGVPHSFVKGDIGDDGAVRALLQEHRPRAILRKVARAARAQKICNKMKRL